MHRSRGRRVTSVLVFSVVLGVVGTYVAAGAAAAAAPEAAHRAGGKPTATLTIIDPGVSVQKKGKDAFKPAKDGQTLRVGDTVETDDTGFAQIDYTDESFTRLDVNTTFTIVSLTDDEGNRQIKTNVESGQTWNRTSELTENETFEQEGAGATAAVAGTAFASSCLSPENCLFYSLVHGITLSTIDGELQSLDALEVCDSTEISDSDANLCGAPKQLTLDAIAANQWLLLNLFVDGLQGFEGIIVVEDGVVVSVTPASPPPDDGTAEPPAADPPVVDDDPVNIQSTGSDPSPGETTGPNTKVSSQDERNDVTFTLQVAGDHPFYIVFTVLPDPSFGRLLKDGVAVDTVVHYAVTDVFTFDPVEMEPDCGSEPDSFEDCFTDGTAEDQSGPDDPNQEGGSQAYPTGDDAPVDFGDGTVRWYGSFTFKAVNSDSPDDASPEVTVTLEVVDDICNPGSEGTREATDFVPSCNE